MLLSFTASAPHVRNLTRREPALDICRGHKQPRPAHPLGPLASGGPLVSSGRAAGKVLAGAFACPVCSLTRQ